MRTSILGFPVCFAAILLVAWRCVPTGPEVAKRASCIIPVMVQLNTSEHDPILGNLMVVGESGTVVGRCLSAQGGYDVYGIVFTSSNPAAVSIAGSTLHALAVGRAVVTGEGLADSGLVEIVAAPLPVDSVQVALQEGWAGTDAVHDSLGKLTQASIPLHGSIYPTWIVYRGNRSVWMQAQEVTVSSSNPSVAEATPNCRPRELDPNCSVVGPGWWVTGMALGETEVSVTVRNVRATFALRVI